MTQFSLSWDNKCLHFQFTSAVIYPANMAWLRADMGAFLVFFAGLKRNSITSLPAGMCCQLEMLCVAVLSCLCFSRQLSDFLSCADTGTSPVCQPMHLALEIKWLHGSTSPLSVRTMWKSQLKNMLEFFFSNPFSFSVIFTDKISSSSNVHKVAVFYQN